MTVSVPCGVFVFLNDKELDDAGLGAVSVPCGVFVFLNRKYCVIKREPLRFPSPAGSSYFSIVLLLERRDAETRFRPLRGLRISQLKSSCLSK